MKLHETLSEHVFDSVVKRANHKHVDTLPTYTHGGSKLSYEDVVKYKDKYKAAITKNGELMWDIEQQLINFGRHNGYSNDMGGKLLANKPDWRVLAPASRIFVKKDSKIWDEPDVIRMIRELRKLRIAGEKLSNKYNELLDQKIEHEKRQKRQKLATAGGVFDQYQQTVSQISLPNPPKKIPTASGRGLDNPYYKGSLEQYAGHVAHYPNWSNYWKDQIMTINEALKRNKQPELKELYTGTFNNGGNRFNFIALGANGKLIWRKYDPSPGAGANWLIINGKKMNTSDFVNASTQKQDQYLAGL